jgi:hypothetical protein
MSATLRKAGLDSPLILKELEHWTVASVCQGFCVVREMTALKLDTLVSKIFLDAPKWLAARRTP